MRPSVLLVCGLAGSLALTLPSLRADHPLPGPHFLQCEIAGNAVHLSWDELGIGDGSVHAAILYRDQDHLAELKPEATAYDDVAPPIGQHIYELQIVARETELIIATRDCTIEVPEAPGIRCEVFGGIAVPPQVQISWDPLPGDLGVTAIQVLRDGEPIAELPADASWFSEEPLSGEHLYTVAARLESGEESLVGSCDLTYEPPLIGGFIRADVNVDEHHDLSDGVRILLYLFSGEAEVPCLEAADTDDNGTVELTDAVYYLGFLFLGGSPPPPPFPACGHDATDDDLSCDVFGPCFTPPPP